MTFTERRWVSGFHVRTEALTGPVGSVLAALTRALALRPAAKPLHPRGVVRPGLVRREGAAERSAEISGVPWLDTPGADQVQVRISRAVGLPPGWPDVHGLALRVEGADGPGDLLLASTGWRGLARFVLVLHRQLRDKPLTTLLPYRSPSGPVLLGARAAGSDRYVLYWARPSGRWIEFGTLLLTDDGRRGQDSGISFDPVRHQLPGLRQYSWVVRLREPAYARARRTRRARASRSAGTSSIGTSAGTSAGASSAGAGSDAGP